MVVDEKVNAVSYPLYQSFTAMQSFDRRNWLKKSGLLLSGFTIGNGLLARQSNVTDDIWEAAPDGPLIRIGQNENPYGPGPMARKAMMDAVINSNRYPSELATQLRERIAKSYNLSKEHVLLGAGSSELLGNTAALAAEKKGSNAVSADPTFRLWFGAAELFGLSIKKVPLTQDKVHDLDAMLKAMDAQTSMVYVVNPHNPTGTIVADSELHSFAEKVTAKCLLLLDEAYTEYAGTTSLAPMVANNKNLVVAKTFSKIHGMAGARVGFVLAHPDTIKKLAAYQPWANAGPSAVSLAGALAAMDDLSFTQQTRQKNEAVRNYVTKEMNQLGLTVIPSFTSFIYYDSTAFKGDLAQVMTQANIVGVRTYEYGTNWRRTSIGTMEEMQEFIRVLRANM